MITAVSSHAYPGLVHERGGLKRVGRRFLGHFVSGDPSEFIVDERQKLLGSLGFPPLHCFEYAGHVAHSSNPAFAVTSRPEREPPKTWRTSMPACAGKVGSENQNIQTEGNLSL